MGSVPRYGKGAKRNVGRGIRSWGNSGKSRALGEGKLLTGFVGNIREEVQEDHEENNEGGEFPSLQAKEGRIKVPEQRLGEREKIKRFSIPDLYDGKSHVEGDMKS